MSQDLERVDDTSSHTHRQLPKHTQKLAKNFAKPRFFRDVSEISWEEFQMLFILGF